MKNNLIRAPKSTVFEKTALELAATWYEIGRGQGMTSKFANPREYAQANFQQFLPKAIELCLDILNKPDTPELMKQEIYTAWMERKDAEGLEFMNEEIPKHQNDEIGRWCDRAVEIVSKKKAH